MKIYVAAPWTEREAARHAKQALEAEGWTVTSRWIDDHPASPSTASAHSPEAFAKEAWHDVQDVRAAHVLLLLNSQKRGEETSGKAVETGIAIEREIPIILLGNWSNVFHFLGNVTWVPTLDEAVGCLRKMEALHG